MSTGGAVAQARERTGGGANHSSTDTMRVSAAAGLTNRLAIEVTWRNGARSLVPDARPNRIYEIDESAAGEVQGPKSKVQSQETDPDPDHASRITHHAPPFFTDVSSLISHKHHEELFDDFTLQPLLPK